MRIREDVLDDPVAIIALRISQTVKEAIALRVFDQVIQVPLLLVTKCFAIANEKLKVSSVRLIDAWIINLIDDAVTQREPEAATRVISGPHAFLRARCPA